MNDKASNGSVKKGVSFIIVDVIGHYLEDYTGVL
jgi:hypothetical protein